MADLACPRCRGRSTARHRHGQSRRGHCHRVCHLAVGSCGLRPLAISASSLSLHSYDVADSELHLPRADDRQSWRHSSASPKESGRWWEPHMLRSRESRPPLMLVHGTHVAARTAVRHVGFCLCLGISEMSASVVSSSDAIEEAFCSALRTTLAGSMTPAFTRSS